MIFGEHCNFKLSEAISKVTIKNGYDAQDEFQVMVLQTIARHVNK